MTFKACKYNCNTQIQWDTDLGAFRESDGKLHDRKRCESLRTTNGNGTGSQQTQQIAKVQAQPQQAQQMATYEVAHILESINKRIGSLEEYYGDLIELLQNVKLNQNKNQEMADQEQQYDQDKEDGLV